MVRNGYIRADLAKRIQAEPVVVTPTKESWVKTQAPAAIATALDELS